MGEFGEEDGNISYLDCGGRFHRLLHLKRLNVTDVNYTSINLKKVNFEEGPIKKMKDKPQNGRKSKHIADKRLLSKVHKELTQPHRKTSHRADSSPERIYKWQIST